MRMLRKPEVARETGYSESHLDWLEKHRDFPRRVKMGTAVAWVEREIQDWLAKKVAARDAALDAARVAELAEEVKAGQAKAEEAEAEKAPAQPAEAKPAEAEPA